jgi:predicted nucleic acid-binding protein
VPVVDANLIVDLVAPGVPVGGAAERLVERLVAAGADVLGPALVVLESSNALLTGIRRGRWDGAAADAAFAQLAQIPVVVADGPGDWQRAFELARRYDNWPVYDMVYVALAERLGTEFYTADDSLRARLAHLPWVRGLNDG